MVTIRFTECLVDYGWLDDTTIEISEVTTMYPFANLDRLGRLLLCIDIVSRCRRWGLYAGDWDTYAMSSLCCGCRWIEYWMHETLPLQGLMPAGECGRCENLYLVAKRLHKESGEFDLWCRALRKGGMYDYVGGGLRKYHTDTVIALKQHIVSALDFSIMPILADALEDAGYDNRKCLTRLRTSTVFGVSDIVLRDMWKLPVE